MTDQPNYSTHDPAREQRLTEVSRALHVALAAPMAGSLAANIEAAIRLGAAKAEVLEAIRRAGAGPLSLSIIDAYADEVLDLLAAEPLITPRARRAVSREDLAHLLRSPPPVLAAGPPTCPDAAAALARSLTSRPNRDDAGTFAGPTDRDHRRGLFEDRQ